MEKSGYGPRRLASQGRREYHAQPAEMEVLTNLPIGSDPCLKQRGKEGAKLIVGQ